MIDIEAVVTINEWIDEIVEPGRRLLIGVAGPPGVGKSTITEAVATARTQQPPVVPMDGFHLSNSVLHALGRFERKGAIDTFDAWGFVSLVRRLRDQQPGEVVYAPVFHRSKGMAEAGAAPIPSTAELVVVEGNYLLVDVEPWAELKSLLDSCVYLDADPVSRVAGLVKRHVANGRSQAEAERFVEQSDEVNARLIDETRSRADLEVNVTGYPGTPDRADDRRAAQRWGVHEHAPSTVSETGWLGGAGLEDRGTGS